MGTRRAAGSATRIITTAIVAIAVVFIVAVSYVFYGQDDAQGVATTKNGVLASKNVDPEVLSKTYKQDSDHDGLADWEEVLWATDPYNSDTDGDGITDNNEIFSGTNQLVSAIELESGEGEVPAVPEEKKSDAPPTSTEVLAKDLFASYMYSLQKEGANLSPEEQERMITEALKNVQPLVQAPMFSRSEVRTVPATPETRAQYISEVQKNIFSMTTASGDEDEAFLALAQGDTEWAVETLSATVKSYTEYTEKLKYLAVPEDAGAVHANLVQMLLQYTYAIEGFTYLNTDPLRAAASVNVFQTVRARLVQAVEVMKNYIEIHQDELEPLLNSN